MLGINDEIDGIRNRKLIRNSTVINFYTGKLYKLNYFDFNKDKIKETLKNILEEYNYIPELINEILKRFDLH